MSMIQLLAQHITVQCCLLWCLSVGEWILHCCCPKLSKRIPSTSIHHTALLCIGAYTVWGLHHTSSVWNTTVVMCSSNRTHPIQCGGSIKSYLTKNDTMIHSSNICSAHSADADDPCRDVMIDSSAEDPDCTVQMIQTAVRQHTALHRLLWDNRQTDDADCCDDPDSTVRQHTVQHRQHWMDADDRQQCRIPWGMQVIDSSAGYPEGCRWSTALDEYMMQMSITVQKYMVQE